MRYRVSALVVLLLLVVGSALAQTPTGTLQGTVVDATQSVVPNVTVRITNTETNEAKALKTDATGHYMQPFLPPGTYNIAVEATGFKKIHQDNVKIDVAQNRTLDFTLAVAANATEVVEVTGAPPALDTNTSTLGQVIENKRVVDLPLNARNPFALAGLSPGVVSSNDGESTPHMGGSRNAVSEAQVDGVTIIVPENNVGVNKRVYDPPIDSVQEFSVQTNALSAEYGRFGGGVINVVTKSGTNQFHGTAFGFFRNSALDANDFFANRAGRAKTDSSRKQYGGSVGGPVFKDKTFFFFDYQKTLPNNPSNFSGSVPPAAWRTGNFSSFNSIIYNPYSAHTDTSPTPRDATGLIRDPFPNNQIPASLMDPVAVKSIAYFPAANTNGSEPTNNFFNAGIASDPSYDWDVKIDHNVSAKWRVFGRLSHHIDNNTPPNNFGDDALKVAEFSNWNGGGIQSTKSWSASLDNTISISPTLIANVRYGFGRVNIHRTPYSDGFDITTLGMPAAFAATLPVKEFPHFEIGGAGAGYPEILGNEGWSRFYMVPGVHDVTTNVTKILSRHSIKTGFEYRKLLMNFAQFGTPTGRWGFDDGWTHQYPNTSTTSGNGVASFLLGLPAWGGNTYDAAPATASSYWAGYVQDDFKVSSKLTLNLGLRYEIERPRTERFNQLSYFDDSAPSPLAGLIAASACPNCGNLKGQMKFVGDSGSLYGRMQVPTHKRNFSPRVGFAFNPTKKMVIRGGFGLAYPPSPFQAAGATGAAGMQGFSSGSGWSTSTDGNRTIADKLSTAYYSGGPNRLNIPRGRAGGASTDLGETIQDSYFTATKPSYSEQWNLNIQHELPGNFTVEAGYLGNRGLHLVWGNTPYPLNQLHPSLQSLGNQLLSTVPNPFYGVPGTGSVGASQTVTYNNLLKPFPQYTSVGTYRKPIGNSMYHGFTLRADKRFSKGLSLLMAYTWGKVMSDNDSAVAFLGTNSSDTTGGIANSYCRRCEWAIDAQDVSHRFVTSFVYDFPFGKGKAIASNLNPVVNKIVAGWQFNGIMSFQTGQPLSIGGGNGNTGIFTASNRLNSTGISAKVSNPNIDRWFNYTPVGEAGSSFSQPASFTIGNLARTLPDVRVPGIANCDFSLFKNNYFGRDGKLNVQIRTEWFNALNTPQFGRPNNNITSIGSAGRITSTAAAGRQIQMAAKFIF